MQFIDDTANVDESYTSLDSEPYVPPSEKKKEEKKEERNAKMQLWKSLTESLKSKMLEGCASEPKSDNVLAEKANLFGKVVADTLLQYEIKKWVYLKKKFVDVFFDYDQQKQVGYGPTLMGAEPSRNSSSSSSLALQEANIPGQNYYLNMQLANRFQYNQQASPTVNQMFQSFSPESIHSQDT